MVSKQKQTLKPYYSYFYKEQSCCGTELRLEVALKAIYKTTGQYGSIRGGVSVKNRKRTIVSVSIIALVTLFTQGCSIARWHDRMMQSAMGCMGMGGHGGHGDQQGAASLVSPALCQAAAYLEHKDELGLTSDQVEKLKSLSLSCQKELITKEAEIKTAGLDYQTLLGNLGRNQIKRSAVEAKGKEIGELYAQMLLIPLGYQGKAMAILTTEQKGRLGNLSPSEPKTSQHKH